VAGRSPMGICPETRGVGSARMRFQLPENSVQAVDRPDVPSQREYIAPMAIRMKQTLEQNAVGFRKSPFEVRKPMAGSRRDGFCSSQHSRSRVMDPRRVSGVYNLHHFGQSEVFDFSTLWRGCYSAEAYFTLHPYALVAGTLTRWPALIASMAAAT
jgi:hypothetical protein